MRLYDCINKDGVYWIPELNWYILIKNNKSWTFVKMYELDVGLKSIDEYNLDIHERENWQVELVLRLSPLAKLLYNIKLDTT